jgi:hypothetical protein
MKLILVCGPWSSGTTVVGGMLEQLGARGLPPYFGTNDPRTPNSFESQPFRELVGELVDESTLHMRVDWKIAQTRVNEFRARLERDIGSAGAPLFLKYPLSALLIPELCAAFPTRLVYVLRPLAAIEATRTRRNWPAQFGAAGAAVVYPRMFEALVERAQPTHIVHYDRLLTEPAAHAVELARFCELPADHARIGAAAAVVRTRDGA